MVYNTSEILSAVKAMPCGRSAWDKGVKELAIMIAEYRNSNGDEYFTAMTDKEVENFYLNGAANWAQYSEGGNLYIYNASIAATLCTPSEFRHFEARNFPNPNSRENWIDCQSRAARQAWQRIYDEVISKGIGIC